MKSIDSGGTFRSVPTVRSFLSEDGQRNTNKDSNSLRVIGSTHQSPGGSCAERIPNQRTAFDSDAKAASESTSKAFLAEINEARVDTLFVRIRTPREATADRKDFCMSFGLGHDRELDPGLGVVGISREELPPIPDSAATDPTAARIDPRRWFVRPELPLEIEIGSGKGTFLLQHGAAHTDVNLLGIEWAREFYAYTADRVRRAGLRNVRVLHTDAVEFLRWRVPDGVATVVHLYFSDPWPKSRHHKRRVVQVPFLVQAHRVLAPGGELRVVTDHAEYWEWMQPHLEQVTVTGKAAQATEKNRSLFERLEFAPPDSAGAGELVGTNFERKYRLEGRPFHACTLRRV